MKSKTEQSNVCEMEQREKRERREHQLTVNQLQTS